MRRAAARAAHIQTSAALTEAPALYRATGWIEVAPFNDEPFADHRLEKTLAWSDRPSRRPRGRSDLRTIRSRPRRPLKHRRT